MKYVLFLVLANITDVATTGWGLTRGNYETNPIAKLLMASGGLPLLLLAKMSIPILAALLLLRASRNLEYLRFVKVVLVGLIAITFTVSGINLLLGITA